MITIEKVDVFGWEAATRGLRNPMNSWNLGDSWWCGEDCPHVENDTEPAKECDDGKCGFCIGYNDLKLMKSLAKAGKDHRKFMRMIMVSADITAPLYWWKEYDTYKVGTVANSCSTMHRLHASELELQDFSIEHLTTDMTLLSMTDTISVLNYLREQYLKTNNKEFWYQMIQLLPQSYNQKRTVLLNYEVLANIHHSRRHHKLECWHAFCDWIETLPYFVDILGKDDLNE